MKKIRITILEHPSVMQAAKQIAAKKDETVSQVIRRALRDYIDADTDNQMLLAGVPPSALPRVKPIGRPRKQKA